MFRNLEAEQARRGYTNADMAQQLDISRVSYESKKKTGKFTTLEIKNLCKIFGCKFDYLFATADDGKEVMEVEVENIKTRDLVEELKKRDGVQIEYAEPHRDKTITVDGPACILVVVD